MAKKKGRDAEKKAALVAKKEAKQEKSARKRLSKGSRGAGAGGGDSDSDVDSDANADSDQDVDRLLQLYKQQDAFVALPGCKVVACEGFPLARANATLTVTDDGKKRDAYLFGGEYHDGAHTVVSDQLFKYELATGKWKQLVCGTAPPPRCAHAAAYYNKCLYIFGGELASATEYHHYRDVWKFDTVKQQWSEISKATAGVGGTTPSARSGAGITVWKHFLVLFGGFYEAELQAPRWYNDVFVLNLQTEQWLDIPHSKLSVRPEPRSACNTALSGDDQWLIHGGFAKLPTNKLQQQQQDDALPTSETVVYTDAWILHLKPLLAGKPPTWERWTSSLSKAKRLESAQVSPNGRSGVGAVSYNRNVLLFGGVVDLELHHHKLDSTFYNDLSIFHVEKRKFIPIRVTGSTAKGEEIKVDESDDDDDDEGTAEDLVQDNDDDKPAVASGWNLNKLRSSMFSFVDGDGNVVYEKVDAVMKRHADKESEEEKEESNEESSKKSRRRHEPPPDLIIERTEPLPRIKSCLFMNGHTLYIFGGLLEVGDREVTLDDMWCIDLRKSRQWKCIFAGTMHKQVWRGAVHDDDDSYYSSNTGGNADDGGLSDSDDDQKEEETKEAEEEKTKESSSGSRKQEIVEMVDRYQLEDTDQTPQPDEALADFYARTSDYWNGKASEQGSTESDATPLSTKELKRGGFALARARFEELEPIVERLMELKLQRKQEKELKAEKREKKPKKSSNK